LAVYLGMALAAAECAHGENKPSLEPSDAVLESINRARAKTEGEFTRLDKQTLKFEGHITNATYKRYLSAMDGDITTLIVNSPGGGTSDGVRIGLDLATRDITVIVDGVAGSSAANYLFTAGKRKVIRNGFVGFHGNATAYNAQTDGEREMALAAKKAGLPEEAIVKMLEDFRKQNRETAALEKEFFKKLGISQRLFDVTQEDGKGLPSAMNMSFEFLLPSVYTMEKFGIRNVVGRQDIGAAEKLGLKVIYY